MFSVFPGWLLHPNIYSGSELKFTTLTITKKANKTHRHKLFLFEAELKWYSLNLSEPSYFTVR